MLVRLYPELPGSARIGCYLILVLFDQAQMNLMGAQQQQQRYMLYPHQQQGVGAEGGHNQQYPSGMSGSQGSMHSQDSSTEPQSKRLKTAGKKVLSHYCIGGVCPIQPTSFTSVLHMCMET